MERRMLATCHCGAVRIEVAGPPPGVTECNCSICGRLGVLWAYYPVAGAQLVAGAEALVSYAWGDRSIAFHHCGICGCTTHYTGIGPEPMDRVAVNARLLPLVDPVPVRRFDGKDTFTALGEHGTWPWTSAPSAASAG
jgi:hypothetical protein